MSHSLWPLDDITTRQHRWAITLLSLSIAFTAYTSSFADVRWPFHSDRDLITKLYNADFAHISDDNEGRMDLQGVMWAFRYDEKRREKCSLLGDNMSLDLSAKYVRFLNTDRGTGTFPSAQFMALSILDVAGKQPGDVFALNPNALAMAMEIEEHGCHSPRVERIRENLVKLLEQRIAWHAVKDHSKEMGLMKQSIVPVNRQALEAAVVKEMELQTQPQALRQISDVEARGGQFSDCEYGPTNPDSTGSETVTFWYKDVPIPMADLLKLSHKHPLARFGDAAVTTCPTTLADARQKLGESRRLGQSHVDPSALPEAHIPLTVMGKERYAYYEEIKKSWMSYQATHDPRDEQKAIAGKNGLLSGEFGFEKACERMKAARQPPDNVHCQIAQQLAEEFRDIPNSPATAVPPNSQPSPPSNAFDRRRR